MKKEEVDYSQRSWREVWTGNQKLRAESSVPGSREIDEARRVSAWEMRESIERAGKPRDRRSPQGQRMGDARINGAIGVSDIDGMERAG